MYKCFIINLINSRCIGGIIIVPVNFISSIRRSDVELRQKFFEKFEIIIIYISIDGKRQPDKNGAITTNKRNTLKTFDFCIKYNGTDIGFITAKVTVGDGGHQDNVIQEIIQFSEWAITQNDTKISYIILFDTLNSSKLSNIKDIIKNYDNIILTNTDTFQSKFLTWFHKNY